MVPPIIGAGFVLGHAPEQELVVEVVPDDHPEDFVEHELLVLGEVGAVGLHVVLQGIDGVTSRVVDVVVLEVALERVKQPHGLLRLLPCDAETPNCPGYLPF